MKNLLPSLASLLVSAACLHATTLIDETFNTPTSVSGNFAQISANNFSYSAAAGVGGTGGVILGTNSTTTAMDNTSFSLAGAGVGTIYTTSLDFQKAALITNTNVMTLGLNSDLTGLGTGSGNKVITRVSRTALNTFSFQYGNVADGTGNLVQAPSGFTVADANTDWYRLAFDLTIESSTSFNLTLNFYSLGLDGTGAATLVSSFNAGSFTNASLLGDATVYAGFRVDGTSNGFTAGDNLVVTAVPEPSALAFVALGLGMTALLKRRRRA